MRGRSGGAAALPHFSQKLKIANVGNRIARQKLCVYHIFCLKSSGKGQAQNERY
jgi:hypothetical protein